MLPDPINASLVHLGASAVLHQCFFIAADNDWNPIEWDRAAEELTWERVNTMYILKQIVSSISVANQ